MHKLQKLYFYSKNINPYAEMINKKLIFGKLLENLNYFVFTADYISRGKKKLCSEYDLCSQSDLLRHFKNSDYVHISTSKKVSS